MSATERPVKEVVQEKFDRENIKSKMTNPSNPVVFFNIHQYEEPNRGHPLGFIIMEVRTPVRQP